MKTRIMYIERKSDIISGEARIGRVTFSKSGSSVYYQGQRFESLKGEGFKSNYLNTDTNEKYWISGCKANGDDRLYAGIVTIDEDSRSDYWIEIRNEPDLLSNTQFRCSGKYRK